MLGWRSKWCLRLNGPSFVRGVTQQHSADPRMVLQSIFVLLLVQAGSKAEGDLQALGRSQALD